jgi:pyruvate formate-lyase activating enzyme-like uncharacterized protein
MKEIKSAGTMRSSLIDITHKCNIRCIGCYYFMEEMDKHKKLMDDDEFNQFVETESARGTNMLTIVGGEPALEQERLKILAKKFKLTVVTNGTIKIPIEGLENIRIAVSFWGDRERDTELRGRGKRNIFKESLENFKNDPRVGFYYTTIPGFSEGISSATELMIKNGNYVTYNFYSDLAEKGGKYNHQNGFSKVNKEIQAMIDKYPNDIVTSPHINNVISDRNLFGQEWGYDVCPSVTYDHPQNAERIKTGKKYPTNFKAYNADLKITRRCCIGNARDSDTCTDLWATYGWVIGSMKAHLQSKSDFSNWLFTMFIFYLQTGFIDLNRNRELLPEIYSRFSNKKPVDVEQLIDITECV